MIKVMLTILVLTAIVVMCVGGDYIPAAFLGGMLFVLLSHELYDFFMEIM